MNKNIEELFREKYNQKFKMMRSILRGDSATAEDVVQEAFTRALKYQNSFDEDRATLEVWFNKILFNSLRDVQQQARNSPPPTQEEEFSLEDVFSQDWFADNPQSRQLLVETLSKVDNPKKKQVLTLFYILGYSTKEVTEIEEGLTQTNVTSIVNRFKNSLKDM